MADFYRCGRCGNVANKLIDMGPELVCCGEPMLRLEANTADASAEKHVPQITRSGESVKIVVGETVHPMEEKHLISFIAAEAEGRLHIKTLRPGDSPEMVLTAEAEVTAYEYCNLHGLWKSCG